MSSGLAIAAVTAVLKDLLNNGLIDHDLTPSVGDVTVTALPPDRVSTAADEKSQLNLFLYQVTPNPDLRNADLHDLRDTETNREIYVAESVATGIKRNRKRVLLFRGEIVAVSRLEDVVDG